MTFLKKLLTAPVFEDEVKTQQASMLHIILWTLLLAPIPFAIVNFLFVTDNRERLLIQIVVGEAINIILLILLKRGHVHLASMLHVMLVWLFFTLTAFTGGGVQGGAYLLGYSIVIAIAGILFGGMGATISTVLSLTSGIILVNTSSLGLRLSPFNSVAPLATWVTSLVLFPVGAVLQHLGAKALRNALGRARASEERYRLISSVTSDYTFSTELDSDGNSHLNWVAGAFEEITGYTYEEYVKTGGWRAHLHPGDLARDDDDMQTLHHNQKVITEVRHYKQNGEVRWARVYGHPMWDNANDRLAGIVGAVTDITEQKQSEERESQRQRMLARVIALGKQVTQVTDVWTTLDRIWHGVHDQLGFSRVGIFLYNAERQSMDGAVGTDLTGKQIYTPNVWFPIEQGQIFKTVVNKPDGLYFTNDFTTDNDTPPESEMYGVRHYAAVAAWAGEKPVAVICVDNLLSGNVISAGELEALRLYAGYAGLAIENARLNASLQSELADRQTLIGELESKNAELERFTYTVSHDLKSPLVTIMGFVSYLEKDALAGRIERVQSGVSRISSAVTKMENLLNDLLELSRIGRLMNAPENVSFEEITRDALERVRGRIEELGIDVSIANDLPIIHGDRERLIEVMQNMLDNAAKFAAETAYPQIQIGTKGFDENLHPILFVCDNGVGIAPEFHERIFGLFNKLNPQIEGTGIGLTIVRRIIEIHGGRIWVESTPGHGATFYFTLPAQNNSQNAA
jgi:PAS domain S-box-containing protein